MSAPLPSGFRPMDAVAALYGDGDPALCDTILTELSHYVFQGLDIQPARRLQQFAARLSYQYLKATTRTETTDLYGITWHQRLLERSGHPYARALLNSSSIRTANLVEGGDPMNGPYLMLAPSIRANADRWDRIFFNSVQCKDVQRRFIHESRATFSAAKSVLATGRPVRLQAVAAGTGLSLILVWDALIRDGADPAKITAFITDRDPANTAKTKHLLTKLSTTRDHRFTCAPGHGIAARNADLLADPPADTPPFDILTAIGILEYFTGTSLTTTWERLGLPIPPAELTADDLAARLAFLTAPGGTLIINTNREHSCIRILELFGKRFSFRGPAEVARLLAPHGFTPLTSAGSGHIYDVELFSKNS